MMMMINNKEEKKTRKKISSKKVYTKIFTPYIVFIKKKLVIIYSVDPK